MQISFLGNFHVSFSSESHHAKSLEKLGHTVIRLQEGETPSEVVLDWAQNSQMFVWIHTHGWQVPGQISMIDVLKQLNEKGIPTVSYHLDLWFGLHREQDLYTDPFYKHIGHFFSVDRLMADWFNKNTPVKGHYLRAGVFEDECIQLEPNGAPIKDVIFVGSKGYHPEWRWRPELIDFLHATYGERFHHIGPDGEGIMRGMELNQLLANSKVVVGDSLCPNFDYPDYWSDRPYEIIGRGGFIIMPYIKGLETEFDFSANLELPTFEFGDLDDVKRKVDYFVENNAHRTSVQNRAFNRVKENYTYTHRWATILKELGL